MFDLLSLKTFPEISHFVDTGGEKAPITMDGVIVFGFRFPIIDLEEKNASARIEMALGLLKRLKTDSQLRILYKSTRVHERIDGSFSRGEHVKDSGFVKNECFLFLEEKVGVSQKSFEAQINPVSHELKALGCVPLEEAEYQEHFFNFDSLNVEKNKIDAGESVIGVVRLKKTTSDEISDETLPSILSQLPKPFSMSVTVKRLDEGKVNLLLSAKKNRDSFSFNQASIEKIDAIDETLKNVALHGEQVFQFEILVHLERKSEEKLREDLSDAKAVMSQIGDGYIETFGCYASYVSTFPGSRMHVPIKEVSPTIMHFLPIKTFGEELGDAKPNPRTLLLHRSDQSLHYFDLFNREFLAFNVLITGRTGSGKSVFGNALSRALLNSEDTVLYKVDVGGSYKRECALYNGTEITFHQDKESGLDPFSLINGIPTNEEISILTELLSTLSQDEGESYTSKSLKANFEEELRRYYEKNQRDPSLHGFLEFANLERKTILSRFKKGGVFEKAFLKCEKVNLSNRYIYFNFEGITGASNKDYSSSIMASVIACVNLKMIKLSKDKEKLQGRRLVFFCDETKFFIDKNQSFFLLTTANFRKFGHSVILTSQNIEDFYLKTVSGVDLGLILNSPIRVFYESQSSAELFRRDFNLTPDQIAVIKHRAHHGRDYREFVLQDDLGTRICRLILSRKEYWEMTSTREDVDHLASLQKHLPWIKTNQAIEIMLKRYEEEPNG